MKLISSERTGHLRVRFKKKRGPPDEARGIVRRRSERKIAMTVRHGSSRNYQRIAGSLSNDARHFTEVIGNQFDVAGQITRPCDAGEKVGIVSQAVPEQTVHHRSIP